MLETQTGQFQEFEHQKETAEPKSEFVIRCEEIIEQTKASVIAEIEEYPIDVELKTNLTQLAGEHFINIVPNEFSNASVLGIILLQNKLSDSIREFRNQVIMEGTGYRQTGTETDLLPKISEKMIQGGLEIEKAVIEKKQTNQ